MQVKELIEMLKDFNQEADVHFSYGYGDHWRTQVAPAVCQVWDGAVQYSDYHRMDKLIEDEEELYEEEGDFNNALRRVVVIG
jgi:hypothetical protein